MILQAAPTGEAAKAGPWWLAVVLLLCVACYFLFRSMSKHLRKVRDEFPVDPPRDPAAPADDRQSDAPAPPAPAERDPEQHEAEA